ncbi:unnamed protein product [Rotaria sp. Silwood2]|nr:unnamed protein product [Rotaria sp. Silwood2]CAF4206916.1 unnamed protein product [Rotaria sp. Silwood2]
MSQQLISIPIGAQLPLVTTWADDDSSLYFATSGSNSTETYEDSDVFEWKDVIQYGKSKPSDGSTIYHIVFNIKNQLVNTKINAVKVLPFKISELLFSSSEQKLVFTSIKGVPREMEDFEIYCIDTRNTSSLSRLTTNKAFEENVKLSMDGKRVLFTLLGLGPTNNNSVVKQMTLHALDLTTGEIQRLAKDFNGSITEYCVRPNGGVYILGQWRTNVQIYTQQSANKYTVLHRAWQGTYESLSSSLNDVNNVMAFVYSSHSQPREVYIVDDVNQLETARVMTNENKLFTERKFPQTTTYQWTSYEDDRMIEGILHYPLGQNESKNLSLLVLIHGGPYGASINQFNIGGGLWAPLAATEGWLVLEPNYRGSTGYGDQFLDEIRYHPLTRPGRDILSGINRLIEDGIVDRNRVTIGGHSYGGFLTNWLITQTTQFNAALSGAGSIEQASLWGTMDLNLLIEYIWGGSPWNSSNAYIEESPIYQFGKVRTPTLIVTAEDDIRVPASQGYIMERALRYLNVPVQLLIFPNEGHSIGNNPWHRKIKVREELKWLRQYGHTAFVKT